MPDITVRAPLAWLGPGRLVDEASVSIADDTIAYAAESRYAPGSEITALVDGAGRRAAPPSPSEGMGARVECAAPRDLFVRGHVQGRGQGERAVGAGIDEIAHAPWTEHLAEELREQMAKSMRIVSTLDIHSYGVDT